MSLVAVRNAPDVPCLRDEQPTAHASLSRRRRSLTAAFVILLGAATSLVGGCSPSADTGAGVAASASSSPTVSSEVTLPDVTGMKGDEALKALQDAGLTSTPVWKDAAGQETVWSPANWSVVAQSPVGGAQVPAGSTVTLTVNHDSKDEAEQQASAAAEQAKAAGTMNSQGLTDGTAIYYCGKGWEDSAQKMFPGLKVKAHTIMGVIASELGTDDRFFIKMTMSVGEADYTVECYIGGSETSPTFEAGQIY